MKSLEIVNLYLEELELHECKEMWLYRTSMQQIKQDLEVLEIIYKKEVNLERLRFYIKTYKDYADNNETLLEVYNMVFKSEHQLTMEELLKLKQWLEENE